MSPTLRTRVCTLLGVDYPILNVGFAEAAGPELASAVTNAGGFGVVGGSGVPPEEMRRRIARVRELARGPFGVNVIIASLEHPAGTEAGRESVRATIATLIDARVPLIVLFWGNPETFIEAAHRNGVKLFIQIGSVEEARAAASAGVDGIIAQGIEAGGHVKGRTSIWDLLPIVVPAVAPVPVLASGGIGDGAGIARALRLGAQGVSMGTRFVASEESWTHRTYKERVARSSAADTFYGELYDVWWPGAPHRTLRNKTFQEWDAAGRPSPGKRPGEGSTIGTFRTQWGEEEPWPRYAVGMIPPDFDGDVEYAPMWAGESSSVVNDVKPAAVIVRDLVRETEAALAG